MMKKREDQALLIVTAFNLVILKILHFDSSFPTS